MPEIEPTLRARARRAVQAELVDAAQSLFLEKGFERTTIDDIASTVGMSRRSFFRYFPSKDDLVVGRYAAWADHLADAMASRPLDEPVWESLRRVFDHVVEPPGDEAARNRMVAMDRIMLRSTTLKAGYLQKLDRVQDRLVGVISVRSRQSGAAVDERDPATRAIVAAAVGCLAAARVTSLAGDDPEDYGGALDTAMAAVVPVGPR